MMDSFVERDSNGTVMSLAKYSERNEGMYRLSVDTYEEASLKLDLDDLKTLYSMIGEMLEIEDQLPKVAKACCTGTVKAGDPLVEVDECKVLLDYHYSDPIPIPKFSGCTMRVEKFKPFSVIPTYGNMQFNLLINVNAETLAAAINREIEEQQSETLKAVMEQKRKEVGEMFKNITGISPFPANPLKPHSDTQKVDQNARRADGSQQG